MSYRIVETDNYGSDYLDEEFLNIPPIREQEDAQDIADKINTACGGPSASRYWKVVARGYVLVPGFEP